MYLISSVFDFCCICTLSACVWQIRACRMQPFSLKERILLLHLFASHLMIIIISIVESKMIKEAVFVKKRIILEDGKNFQGHVKFGLCSDVHINYPLIMSKRRFHVMPFWWSELPFFFKAFDTNSAQEEKHGSSLWKKWLALCSEKSVFNQQPFYLKISRSQIFQKCLPSNIECNATGMIYSGKGESDCFNIHEIEIALRKFWKLIK